MVHNPDCRSCELTAAQFRTETASREWMESLWWRTDREGRRPWAPQTDSDGLPPTETQARHHLQKLKGAHTDCTLLINGRKQTRCLLRPAYLSRQSGNRGVHKRLWSSLYVHVSISLPSCLFHVDTHTMEEGGGIKRKWHAGWHQLCEEMSLQAWGL